MSFRFFTLLERELGPATMVLSVFWERPSNTLYASEDLKEGTRAFAEKRAPVWRGR